ncbi:hypothetical protein DXG01_005597 [Tephrocybe rancida]|nr:hypothetical protein DXG01_005597 [Tephrocybe rancida]
MDSMPELKEIDHSSDEDNVECMNSGWETSLNHVLLGLPHTRHLLTGLLRNLNLDHDDSLMFINVAHECSRMIEVMMEHGTASLAQHEMYIVTHLLHKLVASDSEEDELTENLSGMVNE